MADENIQSNDLLAEQCHPQGNEVLRDPALIKSADFFLNHLILDLIHINCSGYHHHGRKAELFRQENVSSSSLKKKVFIFKLKNVRNKL